MASKSLTKLRALGNCMLPLLLAASVTASANMASQGNRARAADIETLGEEVRRRVLATSGIELHWEIRRIGVGDRN